MHPAGQTAPPGPQAASAERDSQRAGLAACLAAGAWLVAAGGVLWAAGQARWVLLPAAGLLPLLAGFWAGRWHMEKGARQRIAQLRQSEEPMRLFFERQVAGMAITSPDKGWIRVNNRLCDMLGYSRQELAGLTWASLTCPEDLPADEAQFEQLLSGAISDYALEKRFVRKDGSLVDTRLSVACVRRTDGTVDYVLALVEDISQRKRAETALQCLATSYAHLDGRPFFEAVSRHLAGAIGVDCVFVGRLKPAQDAVELLGGCARGQPVDLAGYELAGTPCEQVVGKQFCVYPVNVQSRFPQDLLLRQMGVQAYAGAPLFDRQGQPIGILVALDSKPLLNPELVADLFNTFLERVSAEMQRAQAQERLQANEERLRLALEATSDAIWDWDLTTHLTHYSARCYRMLGYEPGQFPSTFASWAELTHPEDVPRVERIVQQAIALNTGYEAEFRMRAASGSWRWIRGRGKVTARDPNGRPVRLSGANTDITEHKQSQQRLALMSFALDAAHEGAFLMDEQARFQYVNQEACRTLGYTREELLGLGVGDIDPDYPISQWAAHWDLLKTRGNLTLESRHRAKDGRVFVVEVCANYFDHDGRGYNLAMVRDITARKASEQALKDREALWRAVFGNAPYSIAINRLSDGAYLEVNPAFEQRLGLPAASILGKTPLDLFGPANTQEQLAAHDLLLRHGRIENRETTLVRHDGATTDLLYSAATFESGAGLCCVSMTVDITERRRAEAEIQRLNEQLEARVAQRTAQLEAANRELEAFGYSVSHDLRAPLRAIDGYAAILLEDHMAGAGPEGRRVCDVICQSARRMGQLIDDLLAFSRLGRAGIEPVRVDMQALARSAFEEAATPAERARVDFRLAPVPPAWGDPRLLRQVWSNLLANAVKFSATSDQPLVQVTASQDCGQCVYTVRDNGAGFDPRYSAKLFGVFQRLHSEQEFKGTGVGLAIVHRIIHRHGGRVWGQGAVGQGAAFSFVLPEPDSGGPRP